jgi:endonuclease G
LVITVRPGAPVRTGPGSGTAATGQVDETFVEKMVEPWHEDAYRRDGYRADFLGPEVPLPTPTDPASLATLEDGSHVIPYMHFSLAMHRGRRLALYTAANVWDADEVRKPDPNRKYTRAALSGLTDSDVEKWFTDPRLRGLDQLPDKFFTKDRKAFDKGHLVRRDDVAWGETYEELRIANGDTYHVTNCSPQTAGFNRANGVLNWGELEKAVLAQASSQRLSVFAGPVLDDNDPLFAGFDDGGAVRVRIPQAYWKLVVAPDGDGLAAFAFLLEQDLAGVEMERLDFDAKWKSSMRALTDLEARIGRLTFPDILHRADRHGSLAAEAVMEAIGR